MRLSRSLKSLTELWLSFVAVAIILVSTVGSASAYYDDTHYTFSYYMARACGYTPEQAYRMASACVSVDYDSETEPEQRGKLVKPSESALPARVNFHAFMDDQKFPKCLSDPSQEARAKEEIKKRREELWADAKNSGNPGIFLHFLQDETSHRGYSCWAGHWFSPSALVKKKLRLGAGTDYLSYMPERNAEMIDITLDRMKMFIHDSSGGQQRVRNAPIREEVMATLSDLIKANATPGLTSSPNYISARAAVLKALDKWKEIKTFPEFNFRRDGPLKVRVSKNTWSLYSDLTVELTGDKYGSVNVSILASATRQGEAPYQLARKTVQKNGPTTTVTFQKLPVGDVIVLVEDYKINQTVDLAKQKSTQIKLTGTNPSSTHLSGNWRGTVDWKQLVGNPSCSASGTMTASLSETADRLGGSFGWTITDVKQYLPKVQCGWSTGQSATVQIGSSVRKGESVNFALQGGFAEGQATLRGNELIGSMRSVGASAGVPVQANFKLTKE